MVKKTELASYKAQRHSKPLVAINLKGEDELVDVHLTDGLMMFSSLRTSVILCGMTKKKWVQLEFEQLE